MVHGPSTEEASPPATTSSCPMAPWTPLARRAGEGGSTAPLVAPAPVPGRVRVAMALAQDTDVSLLDEPTTYLDLAHQVEILDLLADLNSARRATVVMVLHDLTSAGRYADHLVALGDGRVVAAGSPPEIVTPLLVHEVFSLEAQVIDDPVSHTPLVVPVGGTGLPTRPPLEERHDGGRRAGHAHRADRPGTGPRGGAPLSRVRQSGAGVTRLRRSRHRRFEARLKMVFPVPPGELPRIGKSSEEWYAAWQSASASTGSPMRTYTVRDVLAHGNSRLLVVDMVVHEHGPQGPACRWALRARPGDELQVIAPHRRGLP